MVDDKEIEDIADDVEYSATSKKKKYKGFKKGFTRKYTSFKKWFLKDIAYYFR
mgnify:CR=1 FL=1